MRVLILHSHYLSGALSGENRVVDEEADLLRARHEVDVYRPSPADFGSRTLAARSLFSAGVAAEVGERVIQRKIDVVHCHNLFPTLGPAVLAAASEAGAAVVLTLHNYRLACIAGTFYRDGRVCEDCLGRLPWPGVIHSCYRASTSQSAVIAASLGVARARRTFDSVDVFLAVSEFVREKHVRAGLPAERIVVKPNAAPACQRREGPGSYFLVLSRLSVEKGVAEVVRAWESGLGVLRVAGDGPERTAIETLTAGRGIHMEGAVSADDVPGLLAHARAVLLPSAWFEGQPRVIVEAYAAGVPVIASRIGGLAEVVIDGETGFTVPPGDDAAWRAAAHQLTDDACAMRLGDGAYRLWKERFSPDRGLEMLEAAYSQAAEERARLSKRT
jgi:glycosyltransferase involved in cell wall biosynthesis